MNRAVGTGIMIAASGREFILTAAHVLETYQHNLTYLTDQKDSAFKRLADDWVRKSKTTSGPSGEVDDVDFAVIEVPAGVISREYNPLPKHMVVGSINLKHIDQATLVGYPISRNRPYRGSSKRLVKSRAFVLKAQHDRTLFQSLGLNPLTHWCARFFHKKMKDETGRSITPLSPHGLSGGPAWHLSETSIRTGTDEGARMIGLVSEYHPAHKVIWGPRLPHVLRIMADAYPEIADKLYTQPKQYGRDPGDLEDYRSAIGPE
jgi:hypothetical protein